MSWQIARGAALLRGPTVNLDAILRTIALNMLDSRMASSV